MQSFSEKTPRLQFLTVIFFTVFLTLSSAKRNFATHCGKIKIQKPFSSPNSSISHIITCESNKLFFRTSVGLFRISSIDYSAKTLTISHSSCSSSENYISPSLLSSGLPSTTQKNSVLLFNCLNRTIYARDCTSLPSCGAALSSGSCLMMDDIENPEDLNCTHYRRVHNEYGRLETGSKVSFDIPAHVPDVCKDCKTPNGNCGAGLRCLCHPKECKDEVISGGGGFHAVERMSLSVMISVLLISSV